MSWMSLLYQTYENNKAMAGKSGEKVPLSVVAHMVVNAQIEITIDQEGNFLNACEVDKEDQKTLIPVTEDSQARANSNAPHALSDTLSYIAEDYKEYVQMETEAKKSEKKFNKYLEGLTKWRNSQYNHPKIEAVYHYIEKGCMVHDLVNCGLVKLDDNQKFTNKKITGHPYEKAMVRFIILSGNLEESTRTWEDQALMNCYTNYYLSSKEGIKDICYLTGNEQRIETNHPKAIVASHNKAKLLSSNQNENFVFKGRFLDAIQACTVSYEASQKAHNALTWLVSKQGVSIGGKKKRTYICWNPGGKKIPRIDNPFEYEEEEEAICYTEPEYKIRLKKALNGYVNSLDNNDDIVIMGLDAATEGRLAIIYFNVLKASDYLQRLEYWGNTCNWRFPILGKTKSSLNEIRTPSIYQIVLNAFGAERNKIMEVNEKVLKEQAQRLYYCMLNLQPIPRDIIHAIVEKVSMSMAYNNDNYEQLLSTACALIAKYHNDRKKGSVRMELDLKNRNRSYLFGRLLAIAEKIEKNTYKGDDSRPTNAIRLQAAYVNHPMRTWSVLESALIPYYQKLTPGTAEFFKRQIEDIFELLEVSDKDVLNKSLEETYLIGYYAQRKALR